MPPSSAPPPSKPTAKAARARPAGRTTKKAATAKAKATTAKASGPKASGPKASRPTTSGGPAPATTAAGTTTTPAGDDGARRYHHGDLRRALLDAAIDSITEDGSATFSLRDLARRIGVSHAAPAHHFGDKTGLLTALAVEGYRLLADAQAEAWAATGDFLEVGVAYVRFALDHPAHFEVMYRPELLRSDDPDLEAAHRRSGSFLYGPAGTIVEGDALGAGVAGWALVHGIVALWVNGNLPPELGDDPEAIVRLAGRHLFSAPGSTDALTIDR